MQPWELKIYQLVIENQKKPKGFVRTFATKPARELDNKFGKIFGLIEIRSTDPQIPRLIDLIIEEIKNNYYIQKSAKTEEPPFLVSENFEQALKKTNLSIAAFLESEQVILDIEKINILIGVINNQELHFTIIGDLNIVLFHHLPTDSYRIINVLESFSSPLTNPDPLRIFSQIFSCRIKDKDILFLSTSNILDYFSLEKIKTTLISNPLSEGAIELKNLLEATNIKDNFGVIAMELERILVTEVQQVVIEKFNYVEAASRDSINELIKTEKETEKLLTPSLMPEIKKYLVSALASIKNIGSNAFGQTKRITTDLYQQQKARVKPKLKIKIAPKINPLIPKLPKLDIIPKLKNFIKHFYLVPLAITRKITSSIIKQPVWPKFSKINNKLFGNLIAKFRQLPKSSKILLVISIIFAVLFVQSAILLVIKGAHEKQIEKFDQIILDAENKKNEAEASLIYRDENQARQLLIDSKNLLANLNPSLKSQKQKVEILISAIEDQLQKLRYMVEISEPIQLINFQNLDKNTKVANFILLSGKSVYTPNLDNQIIYKGNLQTKALAALYSPNVKIENLVGGGLIENEFILFNSTNESFKLKLADDSLEKLNLDINPQANISDSTIFNNQIYLLDSKNNQIYRYTKLKNSYSAATNWLKENINLSNTKSLAVDGSVYILKLDGSLIKLENGKQVEFKVNVIDPIMVAPTKIKTDPTSKYLYILDPLTKRLIVLDKEGKLINQYHSESFNDLKDFIVVEKEKRIYLLNGNMILGFAIEHLK